MSIVEIPVPESLRKVAHKKAGEVGTLRNSITKGSGNVAGALGEMVVAAYTGAEIADQYDYDLILPNGSRAEVKTKRTTVFPDASYECSIAAYNTAQLTEAYCFVRVLNSLSIAFILGWMPRQEYFERATFHRAGEVDPDNDFVFKADCYNLKVADLWPIQSLKQGEAA